MEQKNKIPLRQFYRNIDDYILNQSHDEAILYSKFLLKKYPKNIKLYELIGKAYLDTKQYDLAYVLFNKILEIDPDDFVSHIGISLISENFGNLDDAYKSMLRAYEIQPSNESLQNEVIRLIGLKDGFAPEKLRLTRGALIKMYTRSKLAEQAIAEAKLGLHESPDRIDYKVHLADMFAASGKIEDAVEVCLQVIKFRPYCRPILEILYQTLSPSLESDQSDLYKHRLVELDPYFLFVKPETKSVNDIPDVAIMVEAGDIPSDEIHDISSFLENEWSLRSESNIEESKEEDIDWKKIVDDAVENEGIGEPIVNEDIEEVVIEKEESSFAESSKEKLLSKREILKNKLSGSETLDGKHEISGEEIPDWILSYKENSESFEKTIEDDGQEDKKSVSTPQQEFEEDGMTDHAVPINPAIKSEGFKTIGTEWKKGDDISGSLNIEDDLPTLDDTQRIMIVKINPEEVIIQLEKALNENNSEFAIKCLEPLLSKEYKLEDIAKKVESYLNENPEQIEIWLLLVRIYRKLEMNNKALSALEKAQMNISI